MPFYSYFETLFIFLQHQHNNIVIMAVYIALHILVISLRLITFLAYRGHNIWLAVELHPSKALKSTADITGIRSQLLRRIAADYISAAEKNAPRVPLDAIVNKHLLDLSFAGWRYDGISIWVDRLDNGLIFLGIILALVFPQYTAVYGLLAVAGFILLKLSSSFFNYEAARQVLTADIHLYIEREVGRFFAGHVAGAVSRFKEEMAEAIDRQSTVLRGAVEKLGSDLAPLLGKLQSLEDLPKAIDKMQESNNRYALHHETFMSQSEIIKETQTALETSLHAYETTLQNLVQSMGSGMGAFIQMHGQNAANSLTTAMESHMTQLSTSNQEAINTISNLLEQLASQSRDVSAHLRLLHERITELKDQNLGAPPQTPLGTRPQTPLF